MPGRAIHNPFTEKIKSGPIPPQHCYQCLSRKHCDRKTIPFCISKSLIDSAAGYAQNGLVFAGSTIARLKEMTTVHELMKELTE
jgi:NAD(P)H-dependent flavin oxidoreductase YrpB (nitropropane dioxygenase family)